MNRVAIASYGITKFSKEDKPIDSVLLESTKTLFDNTPNLQQNDIDGVLVSTNNNSKYLASILSELSGIKPKISHTVESLCNSGSNAIVSAYSHIASGLADVILVSGAERYDSPGQILEWDNSRGEFKHPIFWATMFSKSYKEKFGITDEDLAIVPVKNHKNAQKNPNALSTKTYSIQDVLDSKKLTEDLRVLDCSRPCTGSASILLTSEKLARKFSEIPVWITGIGQKTTSASFTKNNSLDFMNSTNIAAKDAFEMSNKSFKDINVAEIHDAFSVCEPLALDSIGFSEKGKGMTLVKELQSTDNAMINPRGGLIGSGHPLGATGIAQTIEITQQIQSKAEKRQIDNTNVGLVHNMSAAATSSTILILER